jgi:prepilin-type N-terminal cleavage/methylation domain-containing protein
MKNRSNKGFTLIEIIIVIVIIGVLATLALPRITGQIEGARGAEAMNMFGAIRRAAINCIDMGTVAVGGENAAAANCLTFAQLGMAQPTGAMFAYSAANAGGAMTFTASRGGNLICMTLAATTGASTYRLNPATAANPYFGAVNRTGQYVAGACAAGVNM